MILATYASSTYRGTDSPFIILHFNYFLLPDGLNRHELCHANQLPKPCKCDQCEACFETPYRLERHKMSHIPRAERQRPFSCTMCDSSFPSQVRLNGHLYYHKRREVREEKCGICDKVFIFKAQLKCHLVSRHKLTEDEARGITGMKYRAFIPIILPGQDIIYRDRPRLSCPVCYRKYALREYFESHLIRVHGKTEEEVKEITGLETRDKPPKKARDYLLADGSKRKKNVLKRKAKIGTGYLLHSLLFSFDFRIGSKSQP